MRVAVIGDVKIIGLESLRGELDRQLQEAAERAFDAARWRTLSHGAQARAKQLRFDIVEPGEPGVELFRDQVHARPAFFEKIRDDCDPRHAALRATGPYHAAAN